MTHKPHYENKSLRSKLSLSVSEASSVSDSEVDMSVVEVLAAAVTLEADFVARFLYGFLLC